MKQPKKLGEVVDLGNGVYRVPWTKEEMKSNYRVSHRLLDDVKKFAVAEVIEQELNKED